MGVLLSAVVVFKLCFSDAQDLMYITLPRLILKVYLSFTSVTSKLIIYDSDSKNTSFSSYFILKRSFMLLSREFNNTLGYSILVFTSYQQTAATIFTYLLCLKKTLGFDNWAP